MARKQGSRDGFSTIPNSSNEAGTEAPASLPYLKEERRAPTIIGQAPTVIGQAREKRREARRTPDHYPAAWVEIPLPFSRGVRVVKEIIEFSEKGLSFKMALEEGSLLPGTIIKHLVIFRKGKQTEEPFAEVMYAEPLRENGYLKIGIKLMHDPRNRSAFGRRMFAHALRPIRHKLSRLGPQQKTVQFADHDGLPHSGILKNIPDYGLAFELSESPINSFLRISNIIDPLEVRVGDRSIYSGKGTIATLSSQQGKVIVGISLGEKCDSLHDLIMEDRKTDLVDLKSLFLKLEKINPPFKALVADMRYFLEAVQEAMAKEEEKSSLEGAVHRHRIEKTVLERFERFVFNYLDGAVKDLNQLVCNFDEPAHAVHRDYFQKQLGAIIWQSPFVKRCYSKPLGYAGDYEMMDMIYRDPYEGETWFAKLLNKYFCRHIPPAQASRNRIPLLLQKIEQAVEKAALQQRKGRVLSVACGPSNECIDFIGKSKTSNNAEITLVDIEPEALYHTHKTLLEAKAYNERQTQINVYYLPLPQLFKEAIKLKGFGTHDLIYSAGLFDYLSDAVCRKTIAILYKLLNNNGMLVIGNVDPCNEFKYCMEYCAEWYLIYRTQANLIKLGKDAIGATLKIYCESETTGINNFLIIQK